MTISSCEIVRRLNCEVVEGRGNLCLLRQSTPSYVPALLAIRQRCVTEAGYSPKRETFCETANEKWEMVRSNLTLYAEYSPVPHSQSSLYTS